MASGVKSTPFADPKGNPSQWARSNSESAGGVGNDREPATRRTGKWRKTVKHKFRLVAAFLVLLAGLGVISAVLEKRAAVAAAAVEAPQFEVEPLWPKPLPNHWIQGVPVGGSVDSQDHIWIVHRTNTYEPMEIYAH